MNCPLFGCAYTLSSAQSNPCKYHVHSFVSLQDGKVYVWGTDVAKSKHLARKEKFEGMDVVAVSLMRLLRTIHVGG